MESHPDLIRRDWDQHPHLRQSGLCICLSFNVFHLRTASYWSARKQYHLYHQSACEAQDDLYSGDLQLPQDPETMPLAVAP